MLYLRNNDLPEGILKILPDAAQDTYRQAFNRAWRHYEAAGSPTDLEERVHQVALASVEGGFHRAGSGRWIADH